MPENLQTPPFPNPDAAAPQQGVASPPPNSPTKTSGLGLAALIVGSVALLLAFVPLVNLVSGLLGLVGLVLGVVALIQKGRRRGMSIAGTIVSAVSIILSIILAFAYTAGFFTAVDESLSSDTVAVDQEPEGGTGDDGEGGATAEPEADGPALGSRENPAPIGGTVSINSVGSPEWEVTLGDPTLDANEIVAAENQFNEAPEAGTQYVLLPLTIKYVGTDVGYPSSVEVDFVTASGTTHGSFDNFAVIPDNILDSNELYPDGVATGNIGIVVPSAEIEGGTWRVGASFGEPYFFTVQ